jgi:hypothetical protein
MAELAHGVADEIAARIALPPDAAWVLDVGGGHALHSIALLRRHPALRAIVVDRPEALAAATPNVAASGMEDRIELRIGDFTRDDLGDSFDVALLFNVLHYGDAAWAGALVTRAATALRSGGQVAIFDQFRDAASTPASRAFLHTLALNYVVALRGGILALADVERTCAAAGLGAPQRIALRSAPGSYLLVATKR